MTPNNTPYKTNSEHLSHNMNTNTLERPEAYTDNHALKEVQRMQHEKLLEQKELIATNPEIRQAIASVLTVRKELGDPNVQEADIDSVIVYENFDDARAAMRLAFDFRTNEDGSYGERQEADARAEKYFYPGMTEEIESQINAAAEVLRLSGDTEPEQPETNATVILGGAGRSLLDRTTYAKELIDDGKMKPGKIVVLASERPVNEAERKRGGDYAANATTEFELGIAAIENVYGITIEPSDVTQWVDHSIDIYPLEDDTAIPVENRTHKVIGIDGDESLGRPDIFIVSSAIVTDPLGDATKDGKHIKILRNRANSADTFNTFAHLEKPEPGSRVTMITRSIFEPFQKAAAIKQLSDQGVIVDAASYGATHFGASPDRPHALAMESLSLADALAA